MMGRAGLVATSHDEWQLLRKRHDSLAQRQSTPRIANVCIGKRMLVLLLPARLASLPARRTGWPLTGVQKCDRITLHA
jgi:hypothetical protein